MSAVRLTEFRLQDWSRLRQPLIKTAGTEKIKESAENRISFYLVFSFRSLFFFYFGCFVKKIDIVIDLIKNDVSGFISDI